MFSLTRLALAPRARLTAPVTLPLRYYSDDAGPSRVSYKKMQRRQLRDNVVSGRTMALNDLSFLDDQPSRGRSESDKRSDDRERNDDRRGGRDREMSYGKFDSPRFTTRRDRDTFYIDKRKAEQAAKRDRNAPREKGPSPYASSEKVKRWIVRNDSPLSTKQVDELIAMVSDLPRESVNASVWNLVLALLGREKKYSMMWKAYNQMKKRGVFPSSRTYTTLLNAYAGIAHDAIPTGQFTPLHRPEKLTLDRVRLIYEQSQQHIGFAMRKTAPRDEDSGLEALEWPLSESPEIDSAEVNVSPTNAYLKFLGRFGMWEEMKRVFVSMDTEGPLAPTQVTFTAMLMAANNIATFHRTNPDAAATLAEIDIGPTAKAYWDQAVRQLTGGDRKIDQELALTALQCLASGRPSDQRLVEELISAMWNLPSPSAPSVASASPRERTPSAYAHLPTFKLNVRAATSLMSLLTRMRNNAVAAHYTHLILDTRSLQRDLDLPALRAAVYTFANARDIDSVRSVLDTYQPPTGKDGWPADVWHAALRAARWSADWMSALILFRRMVGLPPGTELGKESGPYKFTYPNNRPTDIRGKPWVPYTLHRADPRAMAALLKTAAAAGLREARQAIAIMEYYGEEHWWIIKGESEIDLVAKPPGEKLSKNTRYAVADRVELAKDLEEVVKRLLTAPKSPEEKEQLERMRSLARAVVKNCRGVI